MVKLLIQHWTIKTAPLPGNLQKPIIFHYSIQWQHPAPIPEFIKQGLIKIDNLKYKYILIIKPTRYIDFSNLLLE